MSYQVNEKLLLHIQCKLICTVSHALVLYDMAYNLAQRKNIKLEEAVEFVIFKFSPKEPCEEVF